MDHRRRTSTSGEPIGRRNQPFSVQELASATSIALFRRGSVRSSRIAPKTRSRSKGPMIRHGQAKALRIEINRPGRDPSVKG